MSQAELLSLLRQMPVFGGLSDSTLEFLLDCSTEKQFSVNEFLFLEGDAATSFFVIRSGTVQVEKDWQGSKVPLGQLAAGDCVGEMAIIDLQSRSASVRCESDISTIEISRSALHGLYRHDLEQYAIIMMNMGREVSRRLRTVTDRLFEIEQTAK